MFGGGYIRKIVVIIVSIVSYFFLASYIAHSMEISHNSDVFVAEVLHNAYELKILKYNNAHDVRNERNKLLREQKILKDEEKKKLDEEKKHQELTTRGQSYSLQELTLLAKLIQSEALGEPYEGKLAVGEVVLNRMSSRGQTMKEVIYAKSQFSGVGGKLFKAEPSEECVTAAKEVMSGSNSIGKAEYFTNLNINKPSWTSKFTFVRRIGDHWFYK